MATAAHAELDPTAEAPVVAALACSLIGEHRQIRTVLGTRAATICGAAPFVGYYVCGYGLAPAWLSVLEEAGLVIGGYADDAGVAMVELRDHPFFLATLFHPQISSGDDAHVHPVLEAFADAVDLYQTNRPNLPFHE